MAQDDTAEWSAPGRYVELRTGAVAHRYTGRPCWAGARYFILDDRGRAFRCYPAKRHKLESLGDFLSDDFRLFDGPKPCRYPLCYCTVPIERGMMPRDAAQSQAAKTAPNDLEV